MLLKAIVALITLGALCPWAEGAAPPAEGPVARRRATTDDVTGCLTLIAMDSFGDGWNGSSWTFTDGDGAVTTGTVPAGSSSSTATLCFGSGGCGDSTLYIDDAGSFPNEQSWKVVDASGTTVASGSGSAGVGISVDLCPAPTSMPTSTPVPTSTQVPTRDGTLYPLPTS